MIAAKNHANGTRNPYAHMRKDVGFDFCNTVSEKNPYVAGPLRRTDCSLVSDGAAALVLAHPDVAAGLERAIAFRARHQANDLLALSRRDPTAFEGARRAWFGALEAAGLTVGDLDMVETHDCFTMAEMIEYEAMGLGRARRRVARRPRRHDRDGRRAAGEPFGRPQVARPSDRGHGRVAARHGVDAAHG